MFDLWIFPFLISHLYFTFFSLLYIFLILSYTGRWLFLVLWTYFTTIFRWSTEEQTGSGKKVVRKIFSFLCFFTSFLSLKYLFLCWSHRLLFIFEAYFKCLIKNSNGSLIIQFFLLLFLHIPFYLLLFLFWCFLSNLIERNKIIIAQNINMTFSYFPIHKCTYSIMYICICVSFQPWMITKNRKKKWKFYCFAYLREDEKKI